MNIIYTVCNRTNLTHALALADSVSKYQPDDLFFICWADALPLNNLPASVQVLTAAETGIPFLKEDWFDFEILAACRPWFALELIARNPACQNLTFLAPTVVLHRSFNELIDSENIVFLTPNITKPLAPSTILDDKRILNIGMYHSGSWSMKPGAQTQAALQWWATRTRDRARFDLCEGMNMDQLWLNYLPIWVPATSRITQPGWHYGLHSILNHQLTAAASGGYSVDAQPLYSTDFAGLTYFDPVWSDHVELAGRNAAFNTLLTQYTAGLKAFTKFVPKDNEPVYGRVPEISRNRLVRNRLAKKLRGITNYIDQF